MWSGSGLLILFLGTPVDEIGGVQSDAEEIGGHETELGGPDADHANNSAVDGGNHPALPELFTEEDGAEDGENTGEIIERNHMKCMEHIWLMSLCGSLL